MRTLLAIAALLAGCGEAPPPVVQPMAFSHASHAEEDLGCVDCHRGADERDAAGFPRLKGCMLCHEEPQGEHPDEPKLRELAEAKKSIPWVRVNGNEGHVFFSHRAHSMAEVECEECHGEVEKLTEPIVRRTPDLHDMDACMDCHEREGASNDCLECHQ